MCTSKKIVIFSLVVIFVASYPPFAVLAAAPTASTGAATEVSSTSRTLTGSVGDTGNKTVSERGFQYGDSTSYGTTAVVTGVNAVVFSNSSGSTGSGNGQFDAANSIAFDSSGNIFIVDPGNNRVQKFNSSGVYQSKFGSAGNGDGQFDGPTGIAVSPSGDILVADTNNQRVQRFNSSGTYQSQFGSIGSGDGQFDGPFGIDIDSDGNIYVADANNNRVQKFNSSGTYITKWGTTGSGEGQFNTPIGLAIDSSNNVYVVDQENDRIQKFNSSGTYITKWGTTGSGEGQFNNPAYIAIDSANFVYVTDGTNQTVSRFTSNGTFLDRWGSDVFNTPQGIGINSNDTVYITDAINNEVFWWIQGTGSFSRTITGLRCNTYHYRAYATNADGTTYGSDATFTNSGCQSGTGFIPTTLPQGKAGSHLTFAAPATTASREITLTLKADSTTVNGYAVSVSPTFQNAVIIPYQDTVSFTLPDRPGDYTLYVKYYSPTGHVSDVVTQTVSYQPAIPPMNTALPTNHDTPNNIPVSSSISPEIPPAFTRSLGLGSTGEDVRLLQRFFNTHGFAVAVSGQGSRDQETKFFGPATRAALIKFQEAHADTVLVPLGLSRGTGYFGTKTRSIITRMLE